MAMNSSAIDTWTDGSQIGHQESSTPLAKAIEQVLSLEGRELAFNFGQRLGWVRTEQLDEPSGWVQVNLPCTSSLTLGERVEALIGSHRQSAIV